MLKCFASCRIYFIDAKMTENSRTNFATEQTAGFIEEVTPTATTIFVVTSFYDIIFCLRAKQNSNK